MHRVLLASMLALCSIGACGFFFPFTVDNMADTRVRARCHFAYVCCTPAERDLVFGDAELRSDEAACVDERTEDSSAFLFQIDQVAKDAVARGAGTFDADAAESCSRAAFDAVNTCDAQALFRGRSLDASKLSFLVDSNDPECMALVVRGYVRGNVDAGNPCLADVDCVDFGVCLLEAEDVGSFVVKGRCVTPHAEGEACDDGNALCQPGLICQFPEDGGAPSCVKPIGAADGESCGIDSDCASGFCESEPLPGTCDEAGSPCEADNDCNEGDTCVQPFAEVCSAAPVTAIEVCNGQ